MQPKMTVRELWVQLSGTWHAVQYVGGMRQFLYCGQHIATTSPREWVALPHKKFHDYNGEGTCLRCVVAKTRVQGKS